MKPHATLPLGTLLIVLTACSSSSGLQVDFSYTTDAKVQTAFFPSPSAYDTGCRLDLLLENRTDERLNELRATIGSNSGNRTSFRIRDVRAGGNDSTWVTSLDKTCADLKSSKIEITRCDLQNHSEGNCIKQVKFRR